MRSTIARGASALALATVLSTAAACGADDSAADDGALKVRTDVYFTGAVLPLVAGVETGIFKEHGLDVELNSGTGSATTIQTVGNGSDDIGYADAGTLTQSVGQGVPVTMVAGMVQKSPLALFAFEEAGISSPDDLAGKTAGYTAGSAAERMFPAFAKASDLDPESVTFKNVDIPTRDQIFMAKETQFTFGLLNTSAPNIEFRCECEPIVFPYSDAGVQTLSSGIVVGNEFLEKHPEKVKKFLEALEEATTYATEHTDEAVDAFFKYSPESKLDPKVVAEQWKRSAALETTDANKGEPWGCMATEDWNSTIDLMEEYGDLEPGSVKPADVATNAQLSGCSADLG